MAITSFAGDYFFLSNFYAVEVRLDEGCYRTVEHAYQAAKTLDVVERTLIRGIPIPGWAKSHGRTIRIRPDWRDVQEGVMEQLLRQKFAYPVLRAQLLATAPQELVEGNWWGDRFWGVCGGVGENKLGLLLMKLREEA